MPCAGKTCRKTTAVIGRTSHYGYLGWDSLDQWIDRLKRYLWKGNSLKAPDVADIRFNHPALWERLNRHPDNFGSQWMTRNGKVMKFLA